MSDIHNDPRWAKLRDRAYRRYGRVCMATGETSGLNVDHIKPASKFPHLAFKLSNVQILHEGINKAKSDSYMWDFRPYKWKLYYKLVTTIKVIAVTLALAALVVVVYQVIVPALFPETLFELPWNLSELPHEVILDLEQALFELCLSDFVIDQTWLGQYLGHFCEAPAQDQ